MAEFKSRADRQAEAEGKPLPEKGFLTPADYKDMIEMALAEAAAESPAGDLLAKTEVTDYHGQYAGLTTAEIGPDGKLTGKYSVGVDWGTRMDDRCMDPNDGMAYAAQRFSTVFHEMRHVEQKALLRGDLMSTGKLDSELATQMTVNELYPSVYSRGYGNVISEVDADVRGLEGALAFFDRHPEIKERYGFDFRKEIMRTDEYDLMDDYEQLHGGTPEELLDKMKEFRADVYDDEWLPDGTRALATYDGTFTPRTESEKTLMKNLEATRGIKFEDLEGMSNDERNVLLIDNAMAVLDDPNQRLASNLEAYKDGLVMQTRCDELVVLLNEMESPDDYDLGEIAGVDGLAIGNGESRQIAGVIERRQAIQAFMRSRNVIGPVSPAISIYSVPGVPGVGPGATPPGVVSPFPEPFAVNDQGEGTQGRRGRYSGFSDIIELTPEDAGPERW